MKRLNFVYRLMCYCVVTQFVTIVIKFSNSFLLFVTVFLSICNGQALFLLVEA